MSFGSFGEPEGVRMGCGCIGNLRDKRKKRMKR